MQLSSSQSGAGAGYSFRPSFFAGNVGRAKLGRSWCHLAGAGYNRRGYQADGKDGNVQMLLGHLLAMF